MKETKLLTRRIGKYEPLNLQAYEADGGLAALKHALTIGPESLIEEIKRSGLAGRGGAGFPTWSKWATVSAEERRPKYFICNAEEGELGTFKDKVMLDGDPWMVFEGILIAAYAIGAKQTYIYINGKYEQTVRLWENLVSRARKAGLLGDSILDSKFSVDLQVVKGKGLYITGEEFGLITSLELHRATSRLKPPYPTEKGLFGRPTVVNNVETVANVTAILEHGVEAYCQFGVEDEPGTRLFSLSGDVKESGVYELEVGSGTLAEFIDEFGQGTVSGRPVKVVQPGGGTSAFLPRASLGCKLTTQAIRQAGSGIGTAGVIVYQEGNSVVDIVKGLLEFYGSESCGRCAPCRIGVVRMKEIVEKLFQGIGTVEDLEQLRKIGKACVATSTCGMGQAFPLPILSALELFPQDFEAAIGKVST